MFTSKNINVRTRDCVLKNNAKIKNQEHCDGKDQGFARPRILILLPFKNHAYELVKALIDVSGTSQQVFYIHDRTTRNDLWKNLDQME